MRSRSENHHTSLATGQLCLLYFLLRNPFLGLVLMITLPFLWQADKIAIVLSIHREFLVFYKALCRVISVRTMRLFRDKEKVRTMIVFHSTAYPFSHNAIDAKTYILHGQRQQLLGLIIFPSFWDSATFFNPTDQGK